MKSKCLILILILSTSISFGQIIDFKTCKKIELINKLIENTDDFKNIITNSEFYSKKINSIDKGRLRFFAGSISNGIKKFKGQCVLTNVVYWYENNPNNYGPFKKGVRLDKFTLYYIGENSQVKPNITIVFSYVNNNWYLQDIDFGGTYSLFSEQDTSYFKNFYKDKSHWPKFFRTETTIDKQNLPYINYDYQPCEKYYFINEILNNPDKLDSLLNNSNFTTNSPVFLENFDSVYKIMKEFFSRYSYKMIWINYPFPVQNKNIEPFLKNVNPKDYFIINFRNDPKFMPSIGLTFEFEKLQTEWKLINVKRGTEICIGLNGNEFISPIK